MTVFIDGDYQCFARNERDGLRSVEHPFFDGKCDTYIEGYRYIPSGETWTRLDGVQFAGEMIAPIREYDILSAAQGESDKAQGEIAALAKAGAKQVQAYCADTGKEPKENSGVFVKGVSEWEAGKTYEKYDLFSYHGVMGYVKQPHTSQETWLPFTPGTEALYGARPAPDTDGIYPYVYNMAASVGMLVRDPDGTVYECTQAISDMLYAPSVIPAHFQKRI